VQLIDDGDVDRLAVAQRLRQVRQHLGVSHAEVAEAIGVAPDEVAQIEAGDRIVDCLELRRLATLYACPLSYLLGMDNPSGGTMTALSRVLGELPMEDHERILQFAALLRHQRTRAPRLRVVTPVPPAGDFDTHGNDTRPPRTRRID
jgi:transcriptional regulator with XRE-family HTH domain